MRSFPPRPLDGIDSWEKIEIDAATRRLAEAAAAAAALSLEAWLERAISRACPKPFPNEAVEAETRRTITASVETPDAPTASAIGEAEVLSSSTAVDDARAEEEEEVSAAAVFDASSCNATEALATAEAALPELPPSLRRKPANQAGLFAEGNEGDAAALAALFETPLDPETEAELALPAETKRRFTHWFARDTAETSDAGASARADKDESDAKEQNDTEAPGETEIADAARTNDEETEEDTLRADGPPALAREMLPLLQHRALRLAGVGAALGLAVAAGALTAQYISVPRHTASIPVAALPSEPANPPAVRSPATPAPVLAAKAPTLETPAAPSAPAATPISPAAQPSEAAAITEGTAIADALPSPLQAIDPSAAAPSRQDKAAPPAKNDAALSESEDKPAPTEVSAAGTPGRAEAAIPVKPSATPDNAPSDPKALTPWLEQRALQGDSLAQYRLGILYALGQGVTQDYAQAAQLFKAAADGGVAEAQYNIAVMYSEGLGVARDTNLALRWYRKAAAQGNPNAAFNLGVAYSNGNGVERSMQDAAQWFRRAAASGIVNAQFNLGLLYERGEGVPYSQTEAYAWYSTAAAHGDNGAAQRRDHLAGLLNPATLKEAQARAQELQKAARSGASGDTDGALPTNASSNADEVRRP